MAPNRTEQTNIKLTEERKQRWTEAAEDEGRSLSNFIRNAVEQHLKDDTGTPTSAPEAGQIDDLADHVIESLEATKRIENDLSRIQGRLNTLEKNVGSTEPVEGLNSEVYGLLPKKEDVPDSQMAWRSVTEGTAHPSQKLENGRIVTGKPEHIAAYLNHGHWGKEDGPILGEKVTVGDVERAIGELRDDLHTIHENVHGGYYRE